MLKHKHKVYFKKDEHKQMFRVIEKVCLCMNRTEDLFGSTKNYYESPF